MRCLVLLLFAWPAVAAPAVRWVDHLGTVHRQELKAVIAESGKEVTVKTKDDKVVAIPLFRVLTLVREDDRREDERALLHAREDVAAGLRLDQARPVLDRLAATGAQPWIREYAAAARAVLAERAGDKDARQRIDQFLERYPDSRFVSELDVANARLRARDPAQLERFDALFAEAFDRIEKRDGPLIARFGALVDNVRMALVVDPLAIQVHMDFTASVFTEKTLDETDVAFHVVAKSCDAWIRLAFDVDTARKVAALRQPPHGPLVRVDRLCKRGSRFLLPETRSDLRRELGLLKLACDDPAGARVELEKARNLAPDRVRREAAEGALARLK